MQYLFIFTCVCPGFTFSPYVHAYTYVCQALKHIVVESLLGMATILVCSQMQVQISAAFCHCLLHANLFFIVKLLALQMFALGLQFNNQNIQTSTPSSCFLPRHKLPPCLHPSTIESTHPVFSTPHPCTTESIRLLRSPGPGMHLSVLHHGGGQHLHHGLSATREQGIRHCGCTGGRGRVMRTGRGC